MCFEYLSGWISISFAFISTSLLLIFHNNVNLAFFLLSSRDGQPRCVSMSVTDDLLWYLLVTYLAALLCTISILCLSFCRYGSQTVLPYSTIGLTREVYAFSFMLLFGIFRFLFRKPMVVFAFWQMLDMCFSHLRSDEIVTPRYF